MYSKIAQLIRHEYSLAFAPTVHDGKIHTLELRVTPTQPTPSAADSTTPQSAPTYKISNRRAYVAPAP
jgi:hypothetical protein